MTLEKTVYENNKFDHYQLNRLLEEAKVGRVKLNQGRTVTIAKTDLGSKAQIARGHENWQFILRSNMNYLAMALFQL